MLIYCRLHEVWDHEGPALGKDDRVRVWREDYWPDQFDIMTVGEALAKYGNEIRYLYPDEVDESQWLGEYLSALE